jgi:hypothetical protein
MMWKLLARDLAIVSLAVVLWPLAAPWSAGTGAVSDFVGLLLGLLVGVCAFLLHEWGHLLGAVAARSRFQPPASLASPFVFTFDSRANSRRQFLIMSFAGFVATALGVWAAYAALPSELLATRVARGAVVFLAFLGVVLEVPLVVYSLVARRVPPIDGRAAQQPAERAAA